MARQGNRFSLLVVDENRVLTVNQAYVFILSFVFSLPDTRMSYDCGPITVIQCMTDGPSSLPASSRLRIAESIKLPSATLKARPSKTPQSSSIRIGPWLV